MDTAPEPNSNSESEKRAVPEVELKDPDSVELVVSDRNSDISCDDDNQNDPLIGKVIARKYELRSVLGSGGMSTVYKAYNLALDATVAVKILHRHLWSKKNAKDRFRVEAKALNELSHENLVSFKDYGVTDDGEPYMVMEFLEGEALDYHISNSGPIALTEVISLFAQLARGLAAAHEVGIVHRDIKPSNVLLIDSARKAKLLDFGIAKIVEADYEGSGARLTQTGEVFGSPLYMSPEQCLGKSVDARSDIYSLGCLIYEAIASKPPFEGASALEIFNKHLSDSPASLLSSKREAELNLLQGLDHVVLKCLEKEPSKRYQSLEDLLIELEKVKSGSFSVPKKMPILEGEERELEEIRANIPLRSSRKLRKSEFRGDLNSVIFAFLAIVAGSAVIAIGGVFFHRVFEVPSKSTGSKKMKVEQASRDADKDARSFDNIAYSYYKAGDYEKAIPLLKFGVATYKEKGTNNNPSYLADNLKHIADCYRNLGKNEEALKWYEEAFQTYRDNNIKNSYYDACRRDYAQALVNAGRSLDIQDLLGPEELN